MSRDNWFAQVVAICWQSATTPSFLIKMKGDQLSFMIYLFKNYKRVPSECSILKVLSILEKSSNILEADEIIFHKLDN